MHPSTQEFETQATRSRIGWIAVLAYAGLMCLLLN